MIAMTRNSAYSPTVSQSCWLANSTMPTPLTAIQVHQFSSRLRASSSWPMTLPEAVNASAAATRSGLSLSASSSTGHSVSQASSASRRPRPPIAPTRSAAPSAWAPCSHCHQPHSATTMNSACSRALPCSPAPWKTRPYSAELVIASGQASGLTRMLQTTIHTPSSAAISSARLAA
jgi:hypothetical protein